VDEFGGRPSPVGYGVERSHRHGDDERTAVRGGARARFIGAQLLLWAVVVLVGAALLAVFVAVAWDEPWRDALGIGALSAALLLLTFGAYGLLAGGVVAEDENLLRWAGIPIVRRGRDSARAGGLTMFGVSLVLSPPLVAVGLSLLG
jgi:hypothetical protein